nr:MazG-like family protein [Streptomyces sp. MST-110588]
MTWLNTRNGTGEEETALRLLKITEEAGEVTRAYLGMTGQNPRKGITHTRDDVADELCDVILSAMTALHSFADAPEAVFRTVVQRRAVRLERLLATGTVDGDG